LFGATLALFCTLTCAASTPDCLIPFGFAMARAPSADLHAVRTARAGRPTDRPSRNGSQATRDDPLPAPRLMPRAQNLDNRRGAVHPRA
jgi:hypothetical protein